jgi:hypothetical protein
MYTSQTCLSGQNGLHRFHTRTVYRNVPSIFGYGLRLAYTKIVNNRKGERTLHNNSRGDQFVGAKHCKINALDTRMGQWALDTCMGQWTLDNKIHTRQM